MKDMYVDNMFVLTALSRHRSGSSKTGIDWASLTFNTEES